MLGKGFFFTESHNPDLPPETWELVAEFTTPGTYTQSLDWGKYRFEASAGGGGSGVATGTLNGGSLIGRTSAASGGSAAYGSFIANVGFENTDVFSLVVGSGGIGGIKTNGAVSSTDGTPTVISDSFSGIIVTLNGGNAGYAYASGDNGSALAGNGGTFMTSLSTHNFSNGKKGISALVSAKGKSLNIFTEATTNPNPYNTGGFGGAWNDRYNTTIYADNGGNGFVRIYKSNIKPGQN